MHNVIMPRIFFGHLPPRKGTPSCNDTTGPFDRLDAAEIG